MTNETESTQTEEQKPAPFGATLKAAREALGLDRRDAAAQLRLNENIIIMMEKDRYPADLPATFIRGYIRSYAKLLQIPEHEVRKAIEPFKPKPMSEDTPPQASMQLKSSMPLTSGNYFMQFFTYLMVFTMLGLVGMWWYTHPPANNQTVADATPAPSPVVNTNPNAPVITNAATAIKPATPQIAATPVPSMAANGNKAGLNQPTTAVNNPTGEQPPLGTSVPGKDPTIPPEMVAPNKNQVEPVKHRAAQVQRNEDDEEDEDENPRQRHNNQDDSDEESDNDSE